MVYAQVKACLLPEQTPVLLEDFVDFVEQLQLDNSSSFYDFPLERLPRQEELGILEVRVAAG